MPFTTAPADTPVARMIGALWAYRGFMLGSVRREYQARYRNSLLGAAWTVLNPLALILIYTVVFSQVMKARLPGMESTFAYSIYLCAGMLSWGLFAEIVGRGQNVFIEHANLLKKLNFPRLCLPVVVVLTAVLNFAIIFGLFVLFLLLTGNFPGWVFFGLVPVLLVEIAFAIGLGIVLGVLNVFFRDVGQLFSVLLQFWFWLTPIVYSVSHLPASVRPFMALNPMAGIVAACQDILVAQRWPQWQPLGWVGLLAMCLCGLGLWLYRRNAGALVDEL